MPQHQTLIKLNFIERTRLNEILQPLLVVTTPHEDVKHRVVRYIDHHSDETVAELAGGRATPGHVASLRRELYGRLIDRSVKPKKNAEDTRRFGDQIAELRGRVARLETELSDLRAALGGG